MEAPSHAPAAAAIAAALRGLLSEDRRLDAAWLFGSAARGDSGPLSDIDVAVLPAATVPPAARLDLAAALAEQLERRFGRADLVLVDEAAPALRHRILSDGILFVDHDSRRRVAFETRAIQEYLDFQPLAAIYDRALLARAREGNFGR